MFTEGYLATGGDGLSRPDLAAEAIRLGKLLAVLMPDEAEPLGLVALMLLQDSRRDARTGPDGELVLLDDQDRSRWDRSEIDEGLALVATALRRGRPGPYQLQAAIAAVHATAATPAETDWRGIVALYDELVRRQPSPVVALNRAVAVAMAEGPQRGLGAARHAPRAGPLPPLPRRPRRPAAPARPWRGGGHRLPAGARARDEPGGAGRSWRPAAGVGRGSRRVIRFVSAT